MSSAMIWVNLSFWLPEFHISKVATLERIVHLFCTSYLFLKLQTFFPGFQHRFHERKKKNLRVVRSDISILDEFSKIYTASED